MIYQTESINASETLQKPAFLNAVVCGVTASEVTMAAGDGFLDIENNGGPVSAIEIGSGTIAVLNDGGDVKATNTGNGTMMITNTSTEPVTVTNTGEGNVTVIATGTEPITITHTGNEDFVYPTLPAGSQPSAAAG